MPYLLLVLFLAAWVGHACIWTSILNYVYARPYPKAILKPWRHFTGLVILGFPWLAFLIVNPQELGNPVELSADQFNGITGRVVLVYCTIGLVFGAVVFPAITVMRLRRKPPAIVLSETTHTLDLWAELGREAIGNGRGKFAASLPFNSIYNVDFTELTLAIPSLPPEWDGLTILHLTDVHYHGTPSRSFHERVLAEIEKRWPNSDLVCLTGDFVDTDEHHTWIGPLLGRLRGLHGNFAILGNHDLIHHPETIRTSLKEAGYTVLGNGWQHATIRGVPCTMIGHEGPWFAPPTDLTTAPDEGFRFCLSHTPDNFYWAQSHRVGLMLCGHVHGGQIRLPVIGSIFVPSMYGRRFDMGVFEGKGTAMVVNRGLSGKEPLRFRCNAQAMRITLRK